MSYDYEDLHEIREYEEYTRSYDTRHVAEIKHLGLETFRVLKDTDYLILLNKIEDQFKRWDSQFDRLSTRQKSVATKTVNLALANEKTNEAQLIQKQIENILIHTLSIDDTVKWDSLKNTKKFETPNPMLRQPNELKQIENPYFPTLAEKSLPPDKNSFTPVFTFFDKLSSKSKQKKIADAEERYNQACKLWEEQSNQIDFSNKKLMAHYEEKIGECKLARESIYKKYEKLHAEWKQEQSDFYERQKEYNEKIDHLQKQYLNSDVQAIIQYCEIVLNSSEYPETFPKNFEIDYNPENKILLVEYTLPSPADIPTLTEVKYIAAKNELKETHLSEVQISKIYDNTIYKITLRTLHELFESDKINAIDAIVFNGWVNSVNKATGKQSNSCIVSIQSKKEEFLEIELSNVDPKICFKNLKGIGSSKLSGITAVQPIAQINKVDKRFVSSYDVADKLSEGDNLASMDWEDFEHLLREIFAKEFSTNGGEVKVTQASRDGGVDAIAFDPDPIRGGKIVIQAKRYTNTVGVSAVRDLYGTVMNEGATKGILVTTADYGPDAYEFARNKPITLMNGANLLYLLEKHGHKAKIDLAEAKKQQLNEK